MKLFNAIVAAAAVGSVFTIMSPSVKAQSNLHHSAAHAQCRYSPSSAADNNCMRGHMQTMRDLDAYMQRNGQPTMQQIWDQAGREAGIPPELMQGLIVR